MSTSNPQFRCEQCGKQYAWKPSLAGRRAKCTCGQTITVPQTVGQEEDLYELAEAPAAPRPSMNAAVAAPPTVPMSATARSPSVLAYGTPKGHDAVADDFDTFYHKPRDFYWPAGVLAAGVVALLAWAVTAGASGGGLIIFSLFITFATLLKTAVMIGAAFVVAPMAGVSFGTFWTAVLKLAAIVVMTDAALFWLQEIMMATGAYPTGGGRRSWAGVGLINTMLAGAIIGILLKIFFDMDGEEVGTLAIPLAILNRVLNFIILLVLAAILSAAA